MSEQLGHLIWIDLEMTGLNPEKDVIIEIATVITDSFLNIIEEGPSLAIHQSDHVLNAMDEWNTKHHTRSGLIERVQKSDLSVAQAEQQTLAFVEKHVKKNQSPMCGNSICQDRRFLARLMPTLESFFHYRHLDVSSVKELARRWAPKVYQGVQKNSNHLAMDDIKESIAELKHYRQHFFKEENLNE